MKTVGRVLSVLVSTRIAELAVAFAIGFLLYSTATALAADMVIPLINGIFGTDISYYNIGRSLEGDPDEAIIFIRVLTYLIAFAMLLPVAALLLHFVGRSESRATKECPYCLSEVPEAASVCSYCASDVSEAGGAEDPGGAR